ncbi:MAG: PHP domain-containing protein [Clostridiales bacterium]|nr:PHP domain-containing protein [Clostridiales bacterium]
MAFWGDYHTHTTYSHGKGSVMDNANAAAGRGLKQVAITDHGLRHVLFGVRRKNLPKMIDDCRQATQDTHVLVLAGIENNLCTFTGMFDAKPDDLEKLDIIQGGYHKAGVSPSFAQEFSFQMRNMFRSFVSKSPKKLIVKNTDAYLKLIDNYELDFIGHMNRDIRADAVEVAKYAKDKGTYVELNNKKLTLTDGELEKMAEYGVEFVCNSDAHKADDVGDMSAVLKVIERLHIPYELIANWERFPSFRSHNYKRATSEWQAKTQAAADKPDNSETDCHVD